MTVKRAINANSRGPLRELAVDLGDHSELVRRVLSALDRDGGVRDDASPRLRDLRNRVAQETHSPTHEACHRRVLGLSV